jgi:hypothetical protein
LILKDVTTSTTQTNNNKNNINQTKPTLCATGRVAWEGEKEE